MEPAALARLRAAAQDYRYLLARGYGNAGALKLVGDRFQLRQRQRQLLLRSVLPPERAALIRERSLVAASVTGKPLLIDGHNVLITLETALGGGLLVLCDDGVLRDVAERHGSYRMSEHTTTAIELLCRGVVALGPASVHCYLDAPMSKSGELRSRLATALGSLGEVSLAPSADGAIVRACEQTEEAVVASSDSIILARVPCGFDLCAYLVRAQSLDANQLAL